MKVLLAEDDGVTRHILQGVLARWGYEVVSAADGEEAWRLLQMEDSPRLAVLDWVMPGMDGLEICRQVREKRLEPYVYIILLTAKGRQEDVVVGMEAGADDYVQKPFDPQELQVRLAAGRRIVGLQAELLAARESMRYLATHDRLTSLVNRAEALDRLQQEINRSKRENRDLCLLLADIDLFKQVNDTHGHAAGDEVLKSVAARMRDGLRNYDTLGRYGGEEFLIILPGCDAGSACDAADRLRKLVAKEPIRLPQADLTVTISIGVVAATTGQYSDPESLIAAADAALYQAKAGGRNLVVLA